MSTQNYANHKQYVVGYHVVTALLILVVLVWAIRQLVRDFSAASVVEVALAFALVGLFWYARAFAIRVQDRVIRLEEQLRLARLLPLDLKDKIGDLTTGQLVALRFAPDAEVSGLVRRIVVGELVTPDSIKRAITAWRPDPVRA